MEIGFISNHKAKEIVILYKRKDEQSYEQIFKGIIQSITIHFGTGN